MNVVVLGGNGQLGTDVVEAYGAAAHRVQALTHDQIEVSDQGSVDQVLGDLSPDLVVNTTAMHNVDRCEEDPARAFAVNAAGPLYLARAGAHLGYALVHVSTDYVFDGSKREPYVETDAPAPLNVYGASKLAGEQLVLAYAPRSFVVRSSGLYGSAPCRAKGGLNFVQTMLKFGRERGEVRVVTDEALAPTYTFDLARQIVALSETDRFGLYHVAARGGCSWYDFARAIFEEAGLDVRVNPTTAAEFTRTVRRPAYSVLDNRRLRDAGLDIMRPWREALADYVRIASA